MKVLHNFYVNASAVITQIKSIVFHDSKLRVHVCIYISHIYEGQKSANWMFTRNKSRCVFIFSITNIKKACILLHFPPKSLLRFFYETTICEYLMPLCMNFEQLHVQNAPDKYWWCCNNEFLPSFSRQWWQERRQKWCQAAHQSVVFLVDFIPGGRQNYIGDQWKRRWRLYSIAITLCNQQWLHNENQYKICYCHLESQTIDPPDLLSDNAEALSKQTRLRQPSGLLRAAEKTEYRPYASRVSYSQNSHLVFLTAKVTLHPCATTKACGISKQSGVLLFILSMRARGFNWSFLSRAVLLTGKTPSTSPHSCTPVYFLLWKLLFLPLQTAVSILFIEEAQFILPVKWQWRWQLPEWRQSSSFISAAVCTYNWCPKIY